MSAQSMRMLNDFDRGMLLARFMGAIDFLREDKNDTTRLRVAVDMLCDIHDDAIRIAAAHADELNTVAVPRRGSDAGTSPLLGVS